MFDGTKGLQISFGNKQLRPLYYYSKSTFIISIRVVGFWKFCLTLLRASLDKLHQTLKIILI